MNKQLIWVMLTFILGLFTASVGGTTYLHVAFASREYVKEIKSDIFKKLDRIDDKLDKIIERVEQ